MPLLPAIVTLRSFDDFSLFGFGQSANPAPNKPLQQTKPRYIPSALRYHACGFAAERQVVSRTPEHAS
jgi:hypothetical protein